MSPGTIKTLEKNLGSNLLDISSINFFLDMPPEARGRIAKQNKTKQNKKKTKKKLLGLHQNKKLLHSDGNN